jgi:hypothetical protein
MTILRPNYPHIRGNRWSYQRAIRAINGAASDSPTSAFRRQQEDSYWFAFVHQLPGVHIWNPDSLASFDAEELASMDRDRKARRAWYLLELPTMTYDRNELSEYERGSIIEFAFDGLIDIRFPVPGIIRLIKRDPS